MKLSKIPLAKEAIFKLSKLNLEDFNKSWMIFQLVKSVNESIEFFTSEVVKIKEKYGDPQPGKAPKAKIEKYEAELNSLLQSEAPPLKDFERIELSMDEVTKGYIPGKPEYRLSAADIASLEPFVDFCATFVMEEENA